MDNNTILEFKKKKQIRKDFFENLDFFEIYNSIRNITKPYIVKDPKQMLWIDSILENKRDSIFFEPNHRYSVDYKELIVEKFYKETTIYVIHPKLNYLFP